MALIDIDSFSFYDQATIVLNGGKFDNWKDEGAIVVDGTYGRNSSGGLGLTTNSRQEGQRGHVTKHLNANYDTIIVGAAVRIDSDKAISNRNETHFNINKTIFSILDGAEPQASLCVTPSMRLVVVQGQAGGELGRSSFYLHENVYYFIEFKCLISSTGGTFSVRVDGITRLTGSGNTQVTTNVFANGIRLGSEYLGPATITGRLTKFDDLYVSAVVAGSTYNDFIGDIMVERRYPTIDRPNNQWAPSSGTLHYALIDDETPNATDHIRSGTVGNIDMFVFGGSGISVGTVIAVVPNIYARKINSAVTRIAPVMNRHGTTTAGAEDYLTNEYRYHYRSIWDKRPNDNSQWALTFANDTYFGVKRSG